MPHKQGLPSNNPHGYKVLVTPIYKQQHITEDEMVGLPCRVTHKIRARSVKIREEDNLYAIFASYVNKPVPFMRQWLKCFSISNSSILT